MNKVTIHILPSGEEPRYFIKIWIEGKTYQIKDVLKSMGFKWSGSFWVKYINPFKENIIKIFSSIKNELSKYVEVRVYSTYFLDRSFEEGIREMIRDCEKWKHDYDKIKESFTNILRKLGLNKTIEEFEKGNIEVSIITIKTKVNDKVITVPRFIEIIDRIENFKEVFNELRRLNYRYNSILKCFEIRATRIVK